MQKFRGRYFEIGILIKLFRKYFYVILGKFCKNIYKISEKLPKNKREDYGGTVNY